MIDEPSAAADAGAQAGATADAQSGRSAGRAVPRARRPEGHVQSRVQSHVQSHVLRDEGSRTDLLHRLRRAEGQLRGVQRMIAEDADCMQIAQQIAAVRRALDSAYVRMTVCFMEQELSSRIAQANEDPVDLSDLLGNIESLLARVR